MPFFRCIAAFRSPVCLGKHSTGAVSVVFEGKMTSRGVHYRSHAQILRSEMRLCTFR